MTPADTILEHEAERLAGQLPPLMVAAERVAMTVAQGIHGRRRIGQGETFWQFRRYEFGDSVQRVDWRQSAKADPVYVRETEWEAAQSVWLWVDRSPSMAFRSASGLPSKGERAAVLGLALATLLMRGGERVALLDDDRPPGGGSARLHRMAEILGRPMDGAPSLPEVPLLPRHANVVLLSDWLAPADVIQRLIRQFASNAVGGHIVQILDPAEEAFPFEGRIRFDGPESEGELLVRRGQSMKAPYQQALSQHIDAIESAVRSVGWSMTRHRTDAPAETALLAAYAAIGVDRGDLS